MDPCNAAEYTLLSVNVNSRIAIQKNGLKKIIKKLYVPQWKLQIAPQFFFSWLTRKESVGVCRVATVNLCFRERVKEKEWSPCLSHHSPDLVSPQEYLASEEPFLSDERLQLKSITLSSGERYKRLSQAYVFIAARKVIYVLTVLFVLSSQKNFLAKAREVESQESWLTSLIKEDFLLWLLILVLSLLSLNHLVKSLNLFN